MPTYLRYDRTSVPTRLTLVIGNVFQFKVSGQGADHKHVNVVSSSSAVTVTVISADPHNAEQSLKLFAKQPTAGTPALLRAFTQDGKPEPTLPVLEVSVEPELTLPDANTEAGALARLLLVENVTPGQRGFDAAETATAMRWMRWVFINQLAFGSQYFARGKKVTTVTELIKAPGQIAGFENYPLLGPEQKQVLTQVLSIHNNAADSRFMKSRQYVQDAIAVAQADEKALGPDPCPTGLYGWRTANSSSPGSNYVKFKTQGGQDFYTLTAAFKANPANPK